MAGGKELRYKILQHLKECEHTRPGPPQLEDLVRDLDAPVEEVSDQLDILDDLGAIDANRDLGGGATPMLKGRGKMLLEEMESEFAPAASTDNASEQPEPRPDYEWDAFIAHASEDKEPFVRELATELAKEFKVWYDDFTLKVGDRLRRKIDEGLARSRYGIVVLSKNFFNKHWPQEELDGLAQREVNGRNVILPVWLDVEYKDVADYSLPLADRIAAKAKDGLDRVVADLRDAIDAQRPQTKPPSTQRQRGHIQVTEDNDLISSDGVLWEWDTYFSGGKGGMDGPLCPEEGVRLKYQTPTPPLPSPSGLLGEGDERPGLLSSFLRPPLFSVRSSRGFEYFEAGREPADQDIVGSFGGGRLFCIKCQGHHFLSGPPFNFTFAGKSVGDARRDAALLFEAKARRRRAKQSGP